MKRGRRSRRITPLTGDPSIDAFAQMRNTAIRKQNAKAPVEMNPIEHKLITQLLPTEGIGRLVCDSIPNADYVKVRIRKFLKELKLNDYIASSTQENEIIFWKIAKYNKWRMKAPVEETKMWQDAQADAVTLYHTSERGNRDYDEDTTAMKRIVDGMNEPKPKNILDGVDLEILKGILKSNLDHGYIDDEEYEEKMADIHAEEIGRAKYERDRRTANLHLQ